MLKFVERHLTDVASAISFHKGGSTDELPRLPVSLGDVPTKDLKSIEGCCDQHRLCVCCSGRFCASAASIHSGLSIHSFVLCPDRAATNALTAQVEICDQLCRRTNIPNLPTLWWPGSDRFISSRDARELSVPSIEGFPVQPTDDPCERIDQRDLHLVHLRHLAGDPDDNGRTFRSRKNLRSNIGARHTCPLAIFHFVGPRRDVSFAQRRFTVLGDVETRLLFELDDADRRRGPRRSVI